MTSKRVFLGLDVGAKRIGLALGDDVTRVAHPLTTLSTNQPAALFEQLQRHDVTDIVIGRPRNQSGDKTAQTAAVEQFAVTILGTVTQPIHWFDESMTSVLAEERLQLRRKPYRKEDIDAEAATIILQDFLETLNGY